jgi:hypothetical protein
MSYSVIFLGHHEHSACALTRVAYRRIKKNVHPSSAKMWRKVPLPFSSTISVAAFLILGYVNQPGQHNWILKSMLFEDPSLSVAVQA